MSNWKELSDRLESMMEECAREDTRNFAGGIPVIQPAYSDFYFGLWPDDYYFPVKICPRLLSDETAEKLFSFLTEHVAGQEVLPDRVEESGHCVFQPGLENSPHGRLMPLHLPAAWARLVTYLYERTGSVAERNAWAGIFARSFERVRFENGLPFLADDEFQVGFGFFDTVGLQGNDLMSAVVLKRGYERAAELFQEVLPAQKISAWRSAAASIAEHLKRLLSPEGWFFSDSAGCRQFSAWPNGLIYGEKYLSAKVKEGIRTKIWAERDTLIFRGMTRQNADRCWRQMNPIWTSPTGIYMDGGFWAVGTGYILRCLADTDEKFARRTVEEMIDNLAKLDCPEWIDADAGRTGGKKFMMSLAIPLGAVRAIEGNTELIELF